jgi:hypothetical protein
MSKIKTILKGGAVSAFLTVILAAPTFAAACTAGAQTGEFEGLYLQSTSSTTAPSGHPVRCAGATMTVGTTKYNIYGKTSADCAKAASLAANPDGCDARGLNSTIQLIINMIIFAIGLIAVVMVIMGGVQYSTSQGDSGKVKKAKDTIMYGIIGLVVAILAFAIVNFVLSSIIQ